MTDQTLHSSTQQIFREILNQPQLALRDDLTANDVSGWDSISHMDLIVAIESHFRIKFTTAEVSRMNNVGDLFSLIRQKAR